MVAPPSPIGVRGMKAAMPRIRRGQRPRDAHATREMLIDAAAMAFAEHGFAGARVDEIAERAGVNKALIYAYYGDKDGLYRAVLSSRLAGPASSLAVTAASDPRQALEEVVRRYFRLLIEDSAFARLLAWHLLSVAPGSRNVLGESAAPGLDAMADLARRAGATGTIRAGVNPEIFRTAVVALAVGYSIQRPAMLADRARTSARFTDDDFVDYACDLLLDGGGGAAPSTRRRRR